MNNTLADCFQYKIITNKFSNNRMEFHVKNIYIKRFLSQYPRQNELKVLKYLTILGIHSLITNNQGNISLEELNKKAKEITKAIPKEEKEINQELKVIRAELAKLNEKFEDKLRALSSRRSDNEPPQQSRRVEGVLSNRKETYRTGRGPADERLYSTLEADNRKRASSIEPEIYPSWWDSNQKDRKSRYSITPKPTEITLPTTNPRLNRNTVTRHHLDDSQAKEVMTQHIPEPHENVSKRTNTEIRDDFDSIRNDRPSSVDVRITHEVRSPTGGIARKPPLFSMSRPNELNTFDSTPTSDFSSDNRTKSPQFAQLAHTKEDIMNNMLMAAQHNEKENIKNLASNTFGKQNKDQKSEQKKQASKQKSNKKPVKQQTQTQIQKSSQNSQRNSNIKKKTGYSTSHTLDLRNVESKIKGEIEYHKNLSRQQKMMANNYNSYNSNSDYNSQASSSQRPTMEFVLVEKENPHGYRSNRLEDSTRVRPEQYYETSTLLESSVNQQRSLINNYYSNPYPERIPSQYPSTSRNVYIPDHLPSQRTNEFSASKSSRDTHRGILDIADNFLSSPLMQHLADGKSSTYSSQNLSQNNTMRKELSHTRFNGEDLKSPDGYQRSPFKRNELEDDQRQFEPHHQYRYSDWGVYKPDTSKITASTSTLKDFIDKRYSYYPYKESSKGILQRDDSSSLASSNFSNFLNDEMKGFYQKEVGELKNSKSRSIMKHGSSENSSNVSFNGNEMGPNFGDEQPMISRKSTYYNFDNNKSYESGNIFKQDMISGARNMNTAQ